MGKFFYYQFNLKKWIGLFPFPFFSVSVLISCVLVLHAYKSYFYCNLFAHEIKLRVSFQIFQIFQELLLVFHIKQLKESYGPRSGNLKLQAPHLPSPAPRY